MVFTKFYPILKSSQGWVLERAKMKKRIAVSLMICAALFTSSTSAIADAQSDYQLAIQQYKVDIEKYLEEFKKTYLKQEFPLVSSKTVLHNGIRKPLWWFYKNGVKREEIVLPIKDIKIYEYDINGISYINSVDMFNSFIERIELIQDEKIKSDLITEKWIEMYNDMIIKYPTNKFIQIDLKMKVSSGFYIRKFCEDFGEYIGVPALAFDITRDEVI